MATETKDQHVTLDAEGYQLDAEGNRLTDEEGNELLWKSQADVSETIVGLKKQIKALRAKGRGKPKGSENGDGDGGVDASRLEQQIEELTGALEEMKAEREKLARDLDRITRRAEAAEQRAAASQAEADRDFITNEIITAAKRAGFRDTDDAVLRLLPIAKLERSKEGARTVRFPMKAKDQHGQEIDDLFDAGKAAALLAEAHQRFLDGNPAGGAPGGGKFPSPVEKGDLMAQVRAAEAKAQETGKTEDWNVYRSLANKVQDRRSGVTTLPA